jgi:hypothetical protein
MLSNPHEALTRHGHMRATPEGAVRFFLSLPEMVKYKVPPQWALWRNCWCRGNATKRRRMKLGALNVRGARWPDGAQLLLDARGGARRGGLPDWACGSDVGTL